MSWSDPRPEATAWYWDSAYDPHREGLLAAVAPFGPFGSVLEIGSHCGPVLRRLRERFGSDFTYLGLDCNALAVSDGEIKFRDDQRASFQLGTVPDDLARFKTGSFDLVISSGCLVCVAPALFPVALYELKRIAFRTVVCQEPQGTSDWLDGQGWAHAYPEWAVTC